MRMDGWSGGFSNRRHKPAVESHLPTWAKESPFLVDVYTSMHCTAATCTVTYVCTYTPRLGLFSCAAQTYTTALPTGINNPENQNDA